MNADGTLIVDPDNDILKVLKGNMGWHCDSTYMPVCGELLFFPESAIRHTQVVRRRLSIERETSLYLNNFTVTDIGPPFLFPQI